jgi:hypothetical protein
MSASDSRLKLTFDMHRTRIQRLFRTRSIYRNIFYGTIVFIALYGLIYVFTPRSGMMSLLPHSWQSGSSGRPTQTAGLWEERQQRVKKAFVHAYHGYEKYAAPMDELKPVSNVGLNKCVVLHYPAPEAIVNTPLQLQRMGRNGIRRSRYHAHDGPQGRIPTSFEHCPKG